MPEKTVRLVITGRVQGVWYRGWAVEMASALGLAGWVRNRRDGSVEALAAGDAAVVERFVGACHQGPPAARVDAVVVEDDTDDPGVGFRQLPTI